MLPTRTYPEVNPLPPSCQQPYRQEGKEEEQRLPKKVFQPFLDHDKDASATSERSRSAELSTGSFEEGMEEEGMEEGAEDLTVKKKELKEEEEREEGVTSTSLDSLDVLKQHLKMNKLPAMEPSAMKTLMEKGRLDALLNPEVKLMFFVSFVSFESGCSFPSYAS